MYILTDNFSSSSYSSLSHNYRKLHQISLHTILIFWFILEKLVTVMRPTLSWLENKSTATYLKAKIHSDMTQFSYWHSFMYITWSIPSHYVILISFCNNLYWEIIICHQHLEFSTAIMKLFKSTWFLPTLCKFRTLAVTVQVNFVVEIDLCATPLYTTES